MTNERQLRLRAIFEQYQWLLVVVAILALVGGAWVTYGAFIDLGEETEQQVTNTWEATGDFDHEATVTEPNALFSVSETLSDQPVYYTEIAPAASGQYQTTYLADSAEEVTVSLEVSYTIRAVADDDGSETVFWEDSSSLTSTQETDVEPGETAGTSFDFDVQAIEARIDEIEDGLGASPGEQETTITIEQTTSGVIDGEPRDLTESHQIDLELDGGTYAFEPPESFDEQYQDTEQVTVERTPSLGEQVGGPAALLVGLVGLVAVGWLRRTTEPLTPAEHAWLEYRKDREEFGDLVTTVALPASALERPEAHLDSLGALSQLAIDVEAVIAEDPRDGRYLVRHDGLLYVYEPPLEPGREATGIEEGAGSEQPPVDSVGEYEETDTETDSDTATDSSPGMETDTESATDSHTDADAAAFDEQVDGPSTGDDSDRSPK